MDSADELFGDPEENWIKIKQFGMTAQEVRNVPSEILNQVLVNPDNANSEFSVIYCLKTSDDTTENYKVTVRIQGDGRYFDDEALVMEIVLTNGDKKVIKTSDVTKEELEKFMSWLAARQQGKGDIFYQIKTADRQYFINYFMITSVDVYDDASYNQQNASEENAVTDSLENPFNLPGDIVNSPIEEAETQTGTNTESEAETETELIGK